MNKTLFITIILAVAAVTVVAWNYINPFYTQIVPYVDYAKLWVTQNLPQVAAIGSLITGGVTIIYNTIYKRLKAATEQEAASVKAAAASATAEASSEVASLKESLAAKDTVIAQLQNGQQEIQPLLENIRTKEQQLRDLENRYKGEISALQARLDKYEPKEKIIVK